MQCGGLEWVFQMITYEPPLDIGIARYVEVLNENGIETFESCQGGEGHAYPEPTVRFHGRQGEGLRAVAICVAHGFRVAALRRTLAARKLMI